MGRIGLGLTLALVLAFSAGRCRGVTIEMVRVGDPGNVDDIHGDGYGGVDYVYWIGKYEVTNGQYRRFLKAKAAVGDPYELYNTWAEERWIGIERTGLGTPEEPYVYSPKDADGAWDTRPVNFVCWFDAIRFVNWLQNGQGDGDTETGTYTIINGGPNSGEVIVPTLAERRSWTTPHFVLPTEDEWYKAAYYKGGSLDAGYWDYATQSDTLPDNNPPELDTGNSANYHSGGTGPFAIGPPYYSNEVGAYGLSPGPYGTFDQCGNVSERTETLVEEWFPVVRGASLGLSAGYLRASYRALTAPAGEGQASGFRVGWVPEPGGLPLLVTAMILLCCYKWRRRSPR
jgi:sulfatase modifying factor 1